MSPRGKHAPSSPSSFYASLGRHIAGGVAVVAVVALVIGLATRDDDGAAVGLGSTTPSPSVSATTSPDASPSAVDTTPPASEEPPREPRPREEITVTVLNGNGTAGLASQTGEKLVAAGYTVNEIDDAERRPKTVIYFSKGAKPEALLLLEDFPELLRVKPASGDEVDASSLLTVILGEDYEA